MTLWRAEQLLVGALYEHSGLDPIIDENMPFDAESHHGPWYRVSMLPARPQSREIGDGAPMRQRGILQVDVFYPKGEYKGGAKSDAQKIIDAYPAGSVIEGDGDRVRVRESWYASGREESRWYHVPVSIAWLAEVQA